MRTFVAIEVPQEIRERIRGLLTTLQRSGLALRWSRPEGLHITLKFLGEVPMEKVETIKTTLQALPTSGGFPVAIRGWGFFPNERAPRVLWLGIQSGPELAQLAARIVDALAPLGFAKESRPFAPHLTLARANGSVNLSSLRGTMQIKEPLAMGSFVAQEFFLYESQLARSGSIYKKIARFPLTTP